MRTNLFQKLNTKLMLLLTLVFLCFDNSVSAGELPQERLAKAEAMFQERCKSAGERIVRTVENVEGIFLIKLRPNGINYGDQFRMDDPYGRDLSGNGYVETFIRGSYQANTRGSSAPGSPQRVGYHYVDAIDTTDGRRYRYTGG